MKAALCVVALLLCGCLTAHAMDMPMGEPPGMWGGVVGQPPPRWYAPDRSTDGSCQRGAAPHATQPTK